MKIALTGMTDSENILEKNLQTSVGLEVAEQIAAKTALINAADGTLAANYEGTWKAHHIDRPLAYYWSEWSWSLQ